MNAILIIILIVLALAAYLLYSRRQTLPCPVWLAWLVEQDNPFTKINRAATIIESLSLIPGMRVLDAGCGPGRLTIPLAKKVGAQGNATALDLQPGMLQRVQEKARLADLHNIQFLQAGIGDGKLGHNQFDRAVLVTVLGEIPNKEIALKELFNALKPGGILSVTETICDPHFQNKDAVRKVATVVGFREKECFGGRFNFTMLLEKP